MVSKFGLKYDLLVERFEELSSSLLLMILDDPWATPLEREAVTQVLDSRTSPVGEW